MYFFVKLKMKIKETIPGKDKRPRMQWIDRICNLSWDVLVPVA